MWKLLRPSPRIVTVFRQYSSTSEQSFIKKIKEQEKKLVKKAPVWEKRDASLSKRYGSWNPTKKLSRQQMNDIRNLSEQMPHLKTIDLANHYKVSPEAIRRILASTWVPKESEEDKIIARGEKRKQKRRELKSEMADEIERAHSRISRVKSINLSDMTLPEPERKKRTNGKKKFFDKNPSQNRRIFAKKPSDISDIIE